MCRNISLPNLINLYIFSPLSKSHLLKIGGDLPLTLPPKMGGYWIDPPLEKFADMRPTWSHHGLDTDSYDIMERDSEAKIYNDLFRPRVSSVFALHVLSSSLEFISSISTDNQ